MIKANHTYLGVHFFNFYARYRLKRNFQSIQLVGEMEPTDLPLLILSNHFSWWDGFIQLFLNQKVIHRKFHVMMLEQQLKKHLILKRTGAFSILKKSRESVESLHYSIDILKDNKNLLLLFPQGEIQSLYTQKFCFQSGVGYIIKNLKSNIQIIFNINLVDYFSDKKPHLSIYYKSYIVDYKSDINTIQNDFNTFAQSCMQNQKEK